MPFVLLPKFKATDLKLPENLPQFPEQIDGILLYHIDGHYLHAACGICLWTVLGELKKFLGLVPTKELLDKEKKTK